MKAVTTPKICSVWIRVREGKSGFIACKAGVASEAGFRKFTLNFRDNNIVPRLAFHDHQIAGMRPISVIDSQSVTK
jgi:hypothetical protein